MTDEEKEQVKTRTQSMISAQLRIWMEDRGFDKYELGKRSGVHFDTIYKIKRGDRKATVEVLALLAAGLNVPLAVLLTPVEA